MGSGIAGLVGVGAGIPDFGAPAITNLSNTACGLTVLYIGLLGPDHDMLRECAHAEPSQLESMVDSPTCSDGSGVNPPICFAMTWSTEMPPPGAASVIPLDMRDS